MAQKEGLKPFRVAVVGLPSCSPNSNSGAGKSCLCNRFAHNAEDEFSTSHSSVLNHEDFTGQFIEYTIVVYVILYSIMGIVYSPWVHAQLREMTEAITRGRDIQSTFSLHVTVWLSITV